jgi:hypothetical protein
MPLRPLLNGLGFVPYSNSPHYSSERERRPVTRQLIAEGVLPDGFATDDGAGLVYFGADLHEAICDTPGAKAYSIVRKAGDQAVETELPTRLL